MADQFLMLMSTQCPAVEYYFDPHRGDHDGEYTLSTVRYQSEGEDEDETVILENPADDDSKV